MENVNRIKAAISAALALLTALWGWFGWLVLAWVGCMALDYLTGSAAAWKRGEWSSATARAGVWHKIGCVAAVTIAGIMDLVLGTLLGTVGEALPFDYTVFLCPLVIVWYILTEAGSIVENAGKLGAPVPSWLRKAIAALRDSVDAAGKDRADKNGPRSNL